MRSAAAAALACACLVAAALGQRPATFRCRHVLGEDGRTWLQDTVVTTILQSIVSVRPADGRPVDVDFGEAWMIPGLIDLHTHLLLRPYNERSWNDQVRHDSDELRTLRGARHATDTLLAGFVAIRDLGTEGAGFADVALQQAMGESVFRGPRLHPATRAIARTGWYGPDPDDPAAKKGAQIVDGEAAIRAAVRAQAAGGATWIKVYADYRKGSDTAPSPSFPLADLQALCDEAGMLGLPVAAHATTDEGIRRAVLAGARTIEHGTGASDDTLQLMRERGVVLVPCLAANEAMLAYAGHRGPLVERLDVARHTVRRALAAGVTIGCGSDAGVFRHGDNARELELLVACGMAPEDAVLAATKVAAQVLGAADLGTIRPGANCGLVVLRGDPFADIGNLRRVRAVIREADELGR